MYSFSIEKFISTLCALLIAVTTYAQTAPCTCAYTISQSGSYNNNSLKVSPGQTVCIQAGRYTSIRLSNFVGTPSQPIRFVNCGGQVTVSDVAVVGGIQIQNSSYFTLSGSGDATIPYGFLMDKESNTSSGVSVGGLSTDYEIERVEIANASYTGFFCKLDPGCDSTTWRNNFTIQNVKIHDNYIHDIGGPGMFLGSGYSSANGLTITCNNAQKTVYPVQMTNLQVYNNRVERTASLGIQVNNAPNASLSNNILIDTNLGPIPPGWQKGGSTTCGCDYTITKADTYNNARLKVKPGQTVCIKAGHYNYMRLNGFVGAPNQPIRFINCEGQVTVGATSGTTGIAVSGSRYIVLSGSGDSSSLYGIRLTQSNGSSGNSMGISVGGLSSDCEIDHIEVGAANFAGIMVKTDPSCDSTTWRNNFTMYNVKIHDNYIHDTGGEGLYIGNSFYGGGMTVTCNGVQRQVYPHLIYGLTIYNNRIERTGCEGIQYSCAPDAQVHDNYINTTGLSPFAAYQNNGLQIGGGAGGDCYNNTVINVPGTGFAVVGHIGNNRIFNNVISQVGVDGIFCDDRPGTMSGTPVQIINNTINGCGRDGIRLYNEINMNTVVNNAITGYSTQASSFGYAGRPIVLEQGATATRVGNFTAIAPQAAGYTNVTDNDFSPLPTSPLIAGGIDASLWAVVTDRLGRPRPVGNPYTIGAYEYGLSYSGAGRMGVRMDRAEPTRPSDAEVLVYPLPCIDRVTIELKGQSIRQLDIYSADGRLIRQLTVHGELQQSITVPTGKWPTGVYTYWVCSDERVFIGRLVKE